MITYELVITRREHNTNFEQEMLEYNTLMGEQDEYRRRNPYTQRDERPIQIPTVYSRTETLNVVISEEQFEIIKANVMKEWK